MRSYSLRVTLKSVYHLAELKEIHVFSTLDGIYLHYQGRVHEFLGSKKNKEAYNFLSSLD